MAGTIEERVASLEANEKSIFKQLDEHSEQIKDNIRLTLAVEKIAIKTDSIAEKVDGIDGRLNAVESQPAKKWDKLKDTLWVAIVSGLASAALGLLLGILMK